MNRTVPAGAAILLEFIYETETSRSAPECYEVIFGHNQGKLKKPITRMTLGEIVDAQKVWSKNYGSSATGAYQFMRATLQGLAKELNLTGNLLFVPDFQDELGLHLLNRRGYSEFMAGKISRTEFGKRLAQEWASFPVLADTQGGSRAVKRGQSYYAGDGLNKSLTRPETVEGILDRVKAASAAPKPVEVQAPVAAPSPASTPSGDPVPGKPSFWSFLSGLFGR